MTRDDGGPAFPAIDFIVPQDLAAKDVHRLGQVRGMSLRDYFAAAALQGLLASAEIRDISFEEYAACAYHHADAMLKERAK